MLADQVVRGYKLDALLRSPDVPVQFAIHKAIEYDRPENIREMLQYKPDEKKFNFKIMVRQAISLERLDCLCALFEHRWNQETDLLKNHNLIDAVIKQNHVSTAKLVLQYGYSDEMTQAIKFKSHSFVLLLLLSEDITKVYHELNENDPRKVMLIRKSRELRKSLPKTESEPVLREHDRMILTITTLIKKHNLAMDTVRETFPVDNFIMWLDVHESDEDAKQRFFQTVERVSQVKKKTDEGNIKKQRFFYIF